MNNIGFLSIYRVQGGTLWLHLLTSVHAFSWHLAFNLLRAWRPSIHHSVCLFIRWQTVVTP